MEITSAPPGEASQDTARWRTGTVPVDVGGGTDVAMRCLVSPLSFAVEKGGGVSQWDLAKSQSGDEDEYGEERRDEVNLGD